MLWAILVVQAIHLTVCLLNLPQQHMRSTHPRFLCTASRFPSLSIWVREGKCSACLCRGVLALRQFTALLRKHHFLARLRLGRCRRGNDVPRDFHHALQAFADAFEVFLHDVFAAFAEILADVFFHRAQHLFVAHAGARRKRRHADEDANETDALHALLEVGVGRDLFRDLHGVKVEHLEPFVADELLAVSRDVIPDALRVGLRALDENAAFVSDAVERIAEVEGVHVIERNEFDVRQFAVRADVFLRDSQVIGRGQTFFLRAVFRIRLHVDVEQFADERRDEFVGRDRAKPADGMAAHGERALRTQIRVFAIGQRERVFDADDGVFARAIGEHVWPPRTSREPSPAEHA